MATAWLAFSSATADMIDFEGYALPNGAIREIADGTAGFDWLGMWASAPGVVTNRPNGQNTGFHNGVVSGDEIGFSQGYASITRADAFTLNSLYLTSAYRNDRVLHITGTGSNGVSYTNDVVLGTSQPSFVSLDWSGLNAVTFQWLAGSNGATVPGWPTGDHFAFDNITFNAPVAPVPLPATAWLLGSAVLGLIRFGRRKHFV